MPPRGIDHLVLAVRDLDAARARYESLGFTVTPRASHPFGTANAIVQFTGRNFLELLEVEKPGKIRPSRKGGRSFAQFNRDFLEDREGMSMLVLEGMDPEADRSAFIAAGLTASEPFTFERDARLPDGTRGRVGFTLVFVTHDAAPRAGFFTCHQHKPEMFWRDAYQSHPNGARSIAEVIFAADDAEAMSAFVADFAGSKAVQTPLHDYSVDTGRGTVTIAPSWWLNEHRPGIAGQMPEPPAFVAFRLQIPDPEAVARRADQAGLPIRRTPRGLVLPAEVMYGVSVIISAR
ncbi:MAG: VOC family protein [Pseudomonadota bacterium]|nr:VOC family protein [Pseudomonadota bacterium]